MKKTTFPLLFSPLLIATCLLSSCNTNESIFGEPNNQANTPTDTTALYESMIRDLEDRILELQQSHYVSDVENQKELNRLQALLEEIQKESSTTPEQAPPSNPDTPQAEAKFLYTTDGNTAVITGYTGTDAHLVIPAVIDGYTVTGIADNALEGKPLQSVIVSNGIQRIGWFAFQKCESLLSITLPASVQSIGFSAFAGAADQLTLYCPEGSYALQYAQSYGLRSATI